MLVIDVTASNRTAHCLKFGSRLMGSNWSVVRRLAQRSSQWNGMNTSPGRTTDVTRTRSRSTSPRDELARTRSPERRPEVGGVVRVDLHPRLGRQALEDRDAAGLGAGVPVLDGAPGVEQQREGGRWARRGSPRARRRAPPPCRPGRWKQEVGVEAGRAAERDVGVVGRARPLHAAGRVDALPGDAASSRTAGRPTRAATPRRRRAARSSRRTARRGSPSARRRPARCRSRSGPRPAAPPRRAPGSPGARCWCRCRPSRPRWRPGSTTSASAVVGVSKPSCTTSRSSCAERDLEHLAVRERHHRVGADHPERLDPPAHDRVDDVGVGAAPFGGQPVLGDAEQLGQLARGRSGSS